MSMQHDPLRAGRRLWVGIPTPELDSKTIDLLQDLQPGGVILFRRNIASPDQVFRLTGELRELCGDSLHICIDQEGGRVVRFPEGVTFFPGNMSLGSWACHDLQAACESAREQGWHTGRELSALGIDVNLAPCVDLLSSAKSRGIGSRSFGSDPQRALKLASALGEGMRSAGVLDCWKHFPGLGRVTVDPHFGLPTTDPQGTEVDLIPFSGAEDAGAGLIMTSHVIARALDSENPVTTSGNALKALRGNLGYSGVIMTDCLEMGGVSDQQPADVAEGSILAGHDVLLVSHTPEIQREIHRRMVEILGSENESHQKSLRRLDRMKDKAGLADGSPQRSGSEVARDICRGGVSLLKGNLPEAGLSGDWSLLLPKQFSHSPVEDPRPALELEILSELLPTVLDVRGYGSAHELRITLEEVESLSESPQVILAIQGVRLQKEYQSVLDGFAHTATAFVLLLLDDPRDLGEMPNGKGVAVLCAHGARPLHLETLAEVLKGEIAATGGQPI